MSRILEHYDESIFTFTDSFMKTIFRFDYDRIGRSSEKSSEKILRLIGGNPQITIAELAQALNLTTRAIEKNLKVLQTSGKIRRIGAAKGGIWERLE